MRAFIAIPCPGRVRDELYAIASALEGLGDYKFVPRENIHITIKFLGEIDGRQKADVERLMDSVEMSPFEVSVKGIGAFPGKTAPKVIWAGIDEGKESLVALHEKVDSGLRSIGFPPEERDYSAHLTIARVRSVSSREGVKEVFDLNSSRDFGRFQVDGMLLMESVLGRGGPEYNMVHQSVFSG